MIDPFDAEFLSQELRDSWKKIECLEEENKKLQEENKIMKGHGNWQADTITNLIEVRNKLEKENRELREQLKFYEGQEELREWNREQYGDY